MVQVAIFDLDGLLVDTELISWKVYQEVLKESHQTMTKEEYAEYYSGVSHENNVKRLKESYQLEDSIELLDKKSSELEKKLIQEGVDLKKGAKELLRYLKSKGFLLALASSSTPDRAETILNQHQLVHYFDCFVFGQEVVKGKPYPDIFLKACQKLGAGVKEAIVFEDSDAGIRAAFSAGIPVICIPDLKEPAKEIRELTEAIYPNLLEAMTYFE
ncbi:HAD family phosphatase [Atopobacter sp. AH10]|uniref:HAD family hydrolase n=1 Tax=Atopobacter sp. AH10 TaxID=2315861 RepID=UPI000EF195CB|nr:HAD family phosphatase [Atopobacter sp. AH10]RLK63493.1 HAD family phosphatase [Atopobacter sp. AH10]